MKKLVKNTNLHAFLFFLFIALAGSAFAQHSSAWKQGAVQSLKDNVDVADEAKAEALLTATFDLKGDAKSAWLRDNTVLIENIPMKSAQIGTMVKGQFTKTPVQNVTLSVRFLRLEKFLGANYTGILHPLYVVNKADANKYNPDLVFGFDLNGDAADDWFAYDEQTKQHGVLYGNPATAQNAPSNQPAAGQQPGVTTLPNGTVVGQGFIITPQGQMMVQQNGGWVPVGTPNPTTTQTASAGAKTATWSQSMTVSQSGDTTLLAQKASLANMGSAQQAMPTAKRSGPGWEIIEFDGQEQMIFYRADGPYMVPKANAGMPTIRVDEVNGIQTRVAVYPDGQIVDLDNNASMAKLTLDGHDFAFSDGKAEAAGVRNAHKFGMRGAAGYDGDHNYGKHGGAQTGKSNAVGYFNSNQMGLYQGVYMGCPGQGYILNNGCWTMQRRAMDGHGCNARAFRPVMQGSSLGGL